jgi:hypothetical protein
MTTHNQWRCVTHAKWRGAQRRAPIPRLPGAAARAQGPSLRQIVCVIRRQLICVATSKPLARYRLPQETTEMSRQGNSVLMAGRVCVCVRAQPCTPTSRSVTSQPYPDINFRARCDKDGNPAGEAPGARRERPENMGMRGKLHRGNYWSQVSDHVCVTREKPRFSIPVLRPPLSGRWSRHRSGRPRFNGRY